MIGNILCDRYEIITRIGEGGMALVYKAFDNLLNRYVAIKVLHQQFVYDEEFIRRFRREAQSAASLSHPNVVNIYDIGQEKDAHFIVMEYIDGHNLNEVILQRAPLSAEEAIHIALQICDALDHAHQHQIIHRDIKPHNILIGRNGRVKVTDFGIARAVASSSITQTGSVVGSVHYFSPEHAKGIATGEKSDLYSLGVVLYQMVTGRLPFHGESPIGVAIKHLQEQCSEPKIFNPQLPQSIENIILKSMRKNPVERYQSAAEMLADLQTCLLPERLQEPKVTFPSCLYADHEATKIMPAIRVESKNLEDSNHHKNKVEMNMNQKGKVGSHKSWLKPATWATIILLFLMIMIGVVYYVRSIFIVDEIEIPNLVHMKEEEALRKLTDLHITVEEPIVRKYKNGFEKGIVFEQSKAAGTKIKAGSTLRLSISEGPLVMLANYAGKLVDTAVLELLEWGVHRSQIEKELVYDDEVEEGKVIRTSPAADTPLDPKATTIKLMVSKGKQSFNMPNLEGLTKEEALAKIKASGLQLAANGVIEEPSYKSQGLVIKQQPYEANDSVTKGAEVRIYISAGYPSEAITYSFPLSVTPEKEGEASKIQITYTDARGENRQWGTKTISSATMLSIELVLAPNKDGAISVTRDGNFIDTYPISYSDVKQGTVNIPSVTPLLEDQSKQSDEDHKSFIIE